MKKAASLFLLLPFLAVSVGYFPLFCYLQSEVRSEIKGKIKQGVPEEELCRIVFDKTSRINWVHDGKEFRIENRMFDVVRTVLSGDKIIYYCINDTQEEALFAGLDEIVKKQMNDPQDAHGKSARALADTFNQLFFPSSFFISPALVSLSLIRCDKDLLVEEGFTGNATPPPDLG